jgi:hypothetical protein
MTRTGRPPKPAIYVLPHGIEVIGEYAPNASNRYWRVRIRPHAFFPLVAVRCGGQDVRRSRVVLASKLGRALSPAEHAHHEDEDRANDAAANVDRLTPAEHNRHHKSGLRHRAESRAKTSASVKRAYAEGRMTPRPILNRDQQGRIAK